MRAEGGAYIRRHLFGADPRLLDLVSHEWLDRLVTDIEPLATIEQEPEQEGRNMTMVLGPTRAAGQAA